MAEPLPPIDTRFKLGPLTEVHRRFLDHYGFLHFDQVLSPEEVSLIKDELGRVAAEWVEEKREHINGVPIFYGQRADGEPFVQRFAFASTFSAALSALVRDTRFEPLLALMPPDARVGEHEKDGVVVNRYINERGSIYKRLGWHTDGLRDLFYLRMPKEMLNVGLHLDDVGEDDGGLCLIPGTHRQGFFSMCFRKLYFLWHRPDPDEISVNTRAGDLTVHDGRLWHRVARSQKTGTASLRHSIYVPYLTGPVEPKSEASPTPGYHRLGVWLRAAKRLFACLAMSVALTQPSVASPPLEPGALAGTFALKLANADWVKIPLLGRRMSRGKSWFLVRREWLPAKEAYRQQTHLCRVYNNTIFGTRISLGEAAIRALPDSEDWVQVEPETGTYRMNGHVQLWGLRGLPDPRSSPLPQTPQEAASNPYAQWIYDMDKDGLPGVTMQSSGVSNGYLLAVQRKQVSLSGRVVSADHVVGRSEVVKENLILESHAAFTDAGPLRRAEAVESPSENWFEERRLSPNAGCAEVLEMEAQGFSERAPQ